MNILSPSLTAVVLDGTSGISLRNGRYSTSIPQAILVIRSTFSTVAEEEMIYANEERESVLQKINCSAFTIT